MPELPEVEVVRRGLDAHVVGRLITGVRLVGDRVARRHLPGPDDLGSRVRGSSALAACRRGKYLWLVLGSPDGAREALIMHLGMSGQLLAQPTDAPAQRHLRAVLDLEDGGGAAQLRFVDQRTFGGLAVSDLVADPWGLPGHTAYGVPAPLTHLAPDLLEPGLDRDALAARMRRRDSAVKRALLDQTLVSGVGNIYADEALWRARLHGERRCQALSRPALGRLLGHAAQVMIEALQAGGTSFDALYVNVNGASGYFDRSLNAYGQEGRPCARCGAPLRREAFMNRSSYSCPRCQPRPRPARAPRASLPR